MNTTSELTLMSEDLKTAFNEPHSMAIRIWHWSLVLIMTASLVTVLLASTLFRTRNNTGMVQQELQAKGLTVSQDQARSVAHAFNDRLWDWHKYAGFILCGLFVVRVLIEFTQSKEEKLGTKIRQAMTPGSFRPEELRVRRHYLQVKWGYLVFYVLLLTMALTGLGLAFEDLSFLKGMHGTIRQVHSFVQYLIYGYILLHLSGVILADVGNHRGIVSGMIHGKKR